jgi:ribosomal protein S18 acetylase RimI-like enzyme
MSLEQRAATPDDIPAVLEFWSVAAEDAGRPADDRDLVRRLVERDPDALRLVVDDEAIVGSVIAGWDGWRCHLYRLAVHPEHRRRGIGAGLIAWAEQRFTDLGGIRADAMVLADNVEAHGAWGASGYVAQQDWARWVKPLM